ncbi:MAG: hypothetical protein OXI01_14125 [Albidovulum sp.]|nr:hypothetical protein [Albidovulum sp.]
MWLDQVFECPDDRLLPVVSGEVEPSAGVNKQLLNLLVLEFRFVPNVGWR